MWDFYLASSEAALRQDTFVVFQLQLARRMDAVPLTRDYIEPWKDAHRPGAPRVRKQTSNRN
jgi:cyclopropane-fatty-acyl-phospholipid synthase